MTSYNKLSRNVFSVLEHDLNQMKRTHRRDIAFHGCMMLGSYLVLEGANYIYRCIDFYFSLHKDTEKLVTGWLLFISASGIFCVVYFVVLGASNINSLSQHHHGSQVIVQRTDVWSCSSIFFSKFKWFELSTKKSKIWDNANPIYQIRQQGQKCVRSKNGAQFRQGNQNDIHCITLRWLENYNT